MVQRRTSVSVPTLETLRQVLPPYGARFDLTLAQARKDVGNQPDPTRPEHGVRLRKWLNDWICHIRVPLAGETDEFVLNLAAWWITQGGNLPALKRRLAELDDSELQAIASVYGELRPLTAQRARNGTAKTFGATATAKVLYFMRPDAVTAWDRKISGHVGGRQNAEGFLDHLTICQAWARSIEAEALEQDISVNEIGSEIGRPFSSTAS